MSNSVVHCPFLNRSDALCSAVFNLDRLTHAFKFCFDRYQACPRYQQLLTERQHRRGGEGQADSEETRDGNGALVQVSIRALPAKAGRKKRRAA
jgi:hypothetical protein